MQHWESIGYSISFPPPSPPPPTHTPLNMEISLKDRDKFQISWNSSTKGISKLRGLCCSQNSLESTDSRDGILYQ